MATINSVDVTKYVDFNYRGFQSSPSLNQQYPFLLTSIDAIKNVIKMYLMSNRGDYGRNLIKGGPLIAAIGKTLNPSNKDTITDMISKAISIYTNIVVTNILVTPDIENKQWVINIAFSDTYNKFVGDINLSISQQQG